MHTEMHTEAHPEEHMESLPDAAPELVASAAASTGQVFPAAAARDMDASLPATALAELERDRRLERRRRLMAAAWVAALALVIVLSIRLPQYDVFRRVGTARVPMAAAPPGNPLTAPSVAPETGFSGALNRLNSLLAFSPGSTQQILNAARQNAKSRDPRVCDFSWDTGQPALRYHRGTTIDSELDDCAMAVRKYLFGGGEKAPD
jgi:hypothetical protein